MGKKAFIALVVIAAVAIYLTIREEGDAAFGGALKPIESVRTDTSALRPPIDPIAVMPTGNSVPQTAQSNYGQMVDRVRTRVNDAMDRSGR